MNFLPLLAVFSIDVLALGRSLTVAALFVGRGQQSRDRQGATRYPNLQLLLQTLIIALAPLPTAAAADTPAFPYDSSKTPVYLGETLQPSANRPPSDRAHPDTAPGTPASAGSEGSILHGMLQPLPAEAGVPRYGAGAVSGYAPSDLRRELASVVDEILDGPWLPLYSDYSAGEAGGVGTAEWCFDRPGDYLRALSLAAPYLGPGQKAKAREYLRNLLKTCPPTQQVYLPPATGKPRNFRKTPPPPRPSPGGPEAQRSLFAEAYAVWAYAQAFDAWDEVQPLFEDLKKLRAQLEARGDFTPAYRSGQAGPLTAAVAGDPEYRFGVYQALLAGCQDNYGYRGARAARQRMEKDKPVFFYVKQLSALLGYHRLALHFAQPDEAAGARGAFDHVAALALEQQAAPCLWSDPDLCPEVARLLRDAAGPWLDELAKTPNVGDLPAVDWNNKVVPGKRDNYVMNPYTWYHAWGGQGEGIRPRTVLGAFLAHARLFNAPAATVRQTLDIPWCQADLYYALKLVAALQAAEPAQWVKVQ